VVGELCIGGAGVGRGYVNDPAQSRQRFIPDPFARADGRRLYRTGDLAKLTEDGRVVIEGRLKDIIHHFGEKVSAEEVEGHVLTHPLVRDAAIVGIPDAAVDERICVFVVLTAEADAAAAPISLRTIREHIRDRGLAPYKLPDELVVVPDLPRTPVGKIDKNALRAGRRELQHR